MGNFPNDKFYNRIINANNKNNSRLGYQQAISVRATILIAKLFYRQATAHHLPPCECYHYGGDLEPETRIHLIKMSLMAIEII